MYSFNAARADFKKIKRSDLCVKLILFNPIGLTCHFFVILKSVADRHLKCDKIVKSCQIILNE